MITTTKNWQYIRVQYVSLLFIMVFCGTHTGHTQQSSGGSMAGQRPDSVYIDFNKDIAQQLLPFEEIYQLAIANSPSIKYEKEISTAQSAVYKLSKMQILQSGAGLASYSTGNQAILSTGPGAPTDAIGQIANGYRLGANFQVSLYDIFGRKQQLKQSKANYQASQYRREVIELQLRRELIDLYQDLITTQQLLRIRFQDEKLALSSMQLAEIEFQQRKIDLTAVSTINNLYYSSKSATEQVRGTFLKFLYNLEAMVGMPIYSLKRK